jgi:CheY-like chemotaxis protein
LTFFASFSGSTFWFTASLPAASPWPYRQKIETEKRDRERDEGRSVLQGRRVLVIDDNVLNQKVAMKMLSSVGCEVTLASSGAAALTILADEEEGRRTGSISIDEIDEDGQSLTLQHSHHGFDAILCDIEMPDLDGYHLPFSFPSPLCAVTQLPPVFTDLAQLYG